MPRADNLQGSLDILVLKILDRRGPLHGYAIATHIERLSEDVLRVEEGSLYPALARMEQAGVIKSKLGTSDTGRKVRMYEVTAAGRKRLVVDEQRWTATSAAIATVLEQA